MLRVRTSPEIKFFKSNYESVVIEAESSDYRVRRHNSKGEAGVGQIIRKYLSYKSGNNYGIVTGPFCTKYEDIHCPDERCSCRAVGLISCDEDGKLVFLRPKRENYTFLERKIKVVKNLIKCVLLRNLSFDERCEIIKTKPINLKDYFERILNLDIDIILDKIEETGRFS